MGSISLLQLVTEGKWNGKINTEFTCCDDAVPFTAELERRDGVRTMAISDGRQVLWMAIPNR